MENKLTGAYIAHYFQRDAKGHYGNEAILPSGGKLSGPGAVVTITEDNMPAEIPIYGGNTMVLGAFKDKEGVVHQVPEVMDVLAEQRRERAAELAQYAAGLLSNIRSASLPADPSLSQGEASMDSRSHRSL